MIESKFQNAEWEISHDLFKTSEPVNQGALVKESTKKLLEVAFTRSNESHGFSNLVLLLILNQKWHKNTFRQGV